MNQALHPTLKEAIGDIPVKSKIEWDEKTILGCATIVARNGAVNHLMSRETHRTVEERSARHLVAGICEGMVNQMLSTNGASPEGIKILKQGIMTQLMKEKQV